VSHIRTQVRASAVAVLLTVGLAVSGAVDLTAATARQPAAKKPTSSTRTPTTRLRSTAPVKPAASAAKTSSQRTTAAAARAKRVAASRAASRRRARAVAARKAREAREVAQPLYKLDASGAIVPDVRAAAAIIYNPVTHEILWEANGEAERSIASITKVMTAVVFLEHEYDLGREVIVDPVDVRGASTTFLRGKERLRLDDLLHLMLIASDNAAARTLARQSIHGPEGFVRRMNEKARELGLEHTTYADPSGLFSDNVSSALDMAKLIAFASSDARIGPIMQKSNYTLATSRRTITVHNTNRLVGSDVAVQGGKTGFIRSAGYCLATLLKLPQGDPVAVVVLGARSNAGRFMETKHLFNWVASKAQSLLSARPPQDQPQPQQP
jgi:D-alanyl-D-alanine endopeptidase (penicillin-binding protein 7)